MIARMRGLRGVRHRPLFLEVLERSRVAMRQLFGLAERLLDDRLDGSVAASAIGAAAQAAVNRTRRARATFAGD